jgi:hypothetical protein
MSPLNMGPQSVNCYINFSWFKFQHYHLVIVWSQTSYVVSRASVSPLIKWGLILANYLTKL